MDILFKNTTVNPIDVIIARDKIEYLIKTIEYLKTHYYADNLQAVRIFRTTRRRIEIFEYLWGFDDGSFCKRSYLDVGKKFKLSRESIRQINDIFVKQLELMEI